MQVQFEWWRRYQRWFDYSLSSIMLWNHDCLATSDSLGQGLTNFFLQGPDNKYFRFVGHLVSVTTNQQCCCSTKQPETREWEWLSSKNTLFTKIGGQLEGCYFANLWSRWGTILLFLKRIWVDQQHSSLLRSLYLLPINTWNRVSITQPLMWSVWTSELGVSGQKSMFWILILMVPTIGSRGAARIPSYLWL